MNRIIKIVLLFIVAVNICGVENPFNRGINLTGWFQANSPTEIHFTKYTRKNFLEIKNLGVDVIRLPINLHSMTTGAPEYKLDPLFLRFLDEVIDWAEELNINLILDNHTFDPAVSTDPTIKNVLIPVWRNMAEHLKERSNLIYYEILNEPHGIGDNEWNAIQKSVIDAIREIDTLHTIVVGPAGWNSYNNLQYMPEYDDDNLVYTFHFYDPFLFTHQGASWTDPSLVPLGGVPFPYREADMPTLPAELEGTWISSSLNNYSNEGTISKVREILDIAIQFKHERNVPIFCGEFGVLMDNADKNDRILWYQIVRSYLESNGIAWTSWDYHGSFGLFEKYSNGLFDYDLNINLIRALGLDPPPQFEFELVPDSIGFGIYHDYIEQNVLSSSYTSGILNFYESSSKSGEYCINWSNPDQYNNIGFKFSPMKDLSYLVDQNYYLGFWIKSNNSSAKFDIRFIDTKENSDDHPWRMGKTITAIDAPFDGTWQYVEIPLASLRELGSWDNAWYEPQGLFDWRKIDRFEIVDEHGVLGSTNLYFDEIKVYDSNTTDVMDDEIIADYNLFQNYPNPFNPSTSIEFTVSERPYKKSFSVPIKLAVYDILGKEVDILLNKNLTPGQFKVDFNAKGIASGNYFYVLTTPTSILTRKMLLLK